MRILCTADLHLGRRSSRLPSDVDAKSLSCAAVWTAIVDYAVAQRVDLVAIAGDVVDQDNRFYEAIGPLEQGLRRLHAAGIPTVAVSGNHDYLVLPTVARSLPDGCLRLLGRGGSWERVTFASRDGTSKVHVDGWSFPTQYVRENPLDAYALPPANDAPILGLLHGDLEVPTSTYAPLRVADLRARSVTMWLLGHVHGHALHALPGGPPVLYPGSPQPMDPGEAGVHGAWLVDLSPGQPVHPHRVPVASVRYESLDIDVDGVPDVSAARERIMLAIQAGAAELASVGGALRHLSLRLRLVGRCAVHRELEAEARSMVEDLALAVGGVQVHIERVTCEARPSRDLESLAAGADAVSLLANLVRRLDGEGDPGLAPELVRALEAIPSTLQAAKPYRNLAWTEDELGPGARRALLARQANLLLDELLTQKERQA
jgi:DNA repair exonuclease SbcCD nuclease subunit